MTAPHPALPLAALVVLATSTTILTRRLGPGTYTFRRSDSAHDLQGQVFRTVSLALAALFLIRPVWPGIDGFAGPVDWLSPPWVAWAGLAVMTLGAAIVVTGQWQMGRSWRIGLGRERTTLVTGGLFARSRNPVFLGFLLVLIGAFLAAANAVTATALGAGWAAMATQIRLEEDHLKASHGADYVAYCARVRRWL